MDIEEARTQIKEKSKHPTVTIGLLIYFGLNVVMLVIGIVKKDECPIDNRIPIYLIVGGAAGIISKLGPLINRKLEWALIDLALAVLYVFEFIWTIAGSVWVYSIYQPNYDPDKGLHCSESAYLMSFWLLTIHWIFLAICVLYCCCCCVLYAFCTRS